MFEEEDFQPLVYGFRLASDVPEAKALALIKESEEELMKEIKNFAPSNSSADESQEMKVYQISSLSFSDLKNAISLN